MSHELKRQYDGEGMGQKITPACSCGWVGRAEGAWNDWQMTNVREQEEAHLREARASENQSANILAEMDPARPAETRWKAWDDESRQVGFGHDMEAARRDLKGQMS